MSKNLVKTSALMVAVLASATLLSGCADDNTNHQNINSDNNNTSMTVGYDDGSQNDSQNNNTVTVNENDDGDNTVITYADGTTCDTSQDDNCPIPDVPSDDFLYAGGMYYWAGGFYYPYPVYLYDGHYYRRGTHTIASGLTASRIPGNAVVRNEPRSAVSARTTAFNARVSSFKAARASAEAARSAVVSARAAGVSARSASTGSFGGRGVGGFGG